MSILLTLVNTRSMYHVQITPKESKLPHRRFEWEYDLSFEQLEQRFLTPYSKANPVVIRGRIISIDDLYRIRVYKTPERIGHLTNKQGVMMEDVTNEFIIDPPGYATSTQDEPANKARPAINAREVFVVHGRNQVARESMFAFLGSIDLIPLEWNVARESTGKPSPYIGDILRVAFSRAHAVVVLLTPDDEVRLKPQFWTDGDPSHETQLTGQARPNVLFEAGMAMGSQPDRVVVVELGNLRPFTDIAGLHIVRMDNSSQRRQELAQKLRTAGCPINLNGEYWHTAGDFEGAVALSTQESSEPIASDESNSEHSQLSEDAKELLTEAVKSPTRTIIKVAASGGLKIKANGRSFTERGNARSVARWEQALRELLNLELIQDPKGKDEVFEVTHRGFQVADSLGTSE